MAADPVGKKRPRSITSVVPWAVARNRCSLRSDASHPTAPRSPRISTQRMNRWNPPPLRTSVASAIAQHPDERDVAVLVRRIEPVADYVTVLDLEAEIIDGDARARPRRLV